MRAAALVVLALAAAPRVASAAVCAGRPTDAAGLDGYSYGAAEVKAYTTANVSVHYATTGAHAPVTASTRTDGVPDTVALAADTAEDALAKYATWGFKAPLRDGSCASNGGDDKLDIYLVSFAGADGTTIPEACDGATCSGFVLCESTFAGRGYATPTAGFQTVITHEFFHVIQDAYDVNLDRFWAEGTAQWAMHTVHPDLADFADQLPPFFASPQLSIDTPATGGVTSGYLYGSAVWPLFLATVHGQDFIRTIFEGEIGGTKAMDATATALAAAGSSMAATFPLFGGWNVATRSLAGTGGYPDAASYPGMKTAALADGTTGTSSGYATFPFLAKGLGPVSITLETDAARNAGVAIPLVDGKAQVDKAVALPASVDGDAIVVVAGITSKKTDAPFTVHVGPPSADTPAVDAGADAAVVPTGDGGGGGGCSCRSSGDDHGSSAALFAGALALVAARRRRR